MAGPRLFGAELGTFRVAGVSLRAGARWAKESRTTSGTVCDGYWPSYPGCRSEEVRSDVTLRSRWIGASYRHESSKLFADVGVRRVANRLRADYRGVQTGRGAGMMVPEEVLASWGFDLGAGMRLSPTSPVAVTITYSTDRVEVWNACATDVGTPFCQAPSRLHALTLGLEIAPWQRPLR